MISRRKTTNVKVSENLFIGSDHPVVVQSMTNTPTSNVEKTTKQIKELYLAGSQIVRITVNDEAAAKAVPEIKEKLLKEGFDVPLVGDFHYNGHLLLKKFPACAKALDKYRINPGNVGYGEKQDTNFLEMIDVAIANDKAVRIGVNWGSLDQELLTKKMNENASLTLPKSDKEVIYETIIASALGSAELAQKRGLAKDKIIISAKMSDVQDLINVYRLLAKECNYPLHLGLTEAGNPIKGMISSSVAMGILLQEGIGDTIRMSLTPETKTESEKKLFISTNPLSDRSLEVKACQELLQAMGIRYFKPQVTSCPGCGRTSNDYFQKLAEEINEHINEEINNWKKEYPGVEQLKIAVMGCIVNGPGESKHADIGISLPGDNEDPIAPVYIDGEHKLTLRGDKIGTEFKQILKNYIKEKLSIRLSSKAF